MAIPLDQVTPAVGLGNVREIVQAGMLNRCFLAYSATANTDATIQKKRLYLCAKVAADQEIYLTDFVWMVLTETTVTAVSAVDNTVVTSVINQNNWDMMADLLVPTSAVS